jgi:hypothetical protein
MVDMARSALESGASRSIARAIARRTSLGRFEEVSVIKVMMESLKFFMLLEKYGDKKNED